MTSGRWILTIVSAAAFSIVGDAAERQSSRGVNFVIQAMKETVTSGSAVFVAATITNRSGKPISVVIGCPGFDHSVEVAIVGAGRPRKAESLHTVNVCASNALIDLAPGQSQTEPVEVISSYNLTSPRKYSIRVSSRYSVGSKSWRFARSNTVEVLVTSAASSN